MQRDYTEYRPATPQDITYLSPCTMIIRGGQMKRSYSLDIYG